jgi:hypothetical protein
MQGCCKTNRGNFYQKKIWMKHYVRSAMLDYIANNLFHYKVVSTYSIEIVYQSILNYKLSKISFH